MLEVVRFVNSRFNSNTYVISHPKYDNVWVVDPGDTEPFFEWMKIHSKNSITGILLTHAHFDHIYGMNEIITHFPNCIVYIANDYGLEALHNSKKNGSKYTEEGPIEIVENAKVEFYSDTIQLWNKVKMKTINTPGHSDDSQCLLVEGMLFTGDTLIKGVRTVTKLKGGSVEKLNRSMNLISSMKGFEFIVYPGHGDIFPLDEYDLLKMVN